MKKPIVIIWLIILFSWSGVIWVTNLKEVEDEKNQILLFGLLLPALTFSLSFLIFLIRIITRRGQDERVVYKSSFWWTLLPVTIVLIGMFLKTRQMLDVTYLFLLIGILITGSMFLRYSLRRGR